MIACLRRVLLACILFLQLGSLDSAEPGPGGLRADVWRAIGAMPRVLYVEYEEQKQQLFAIPGWEVEVAEALARLAIAARTVDTPLADPRDENEMQRLSDKIDDKTILPDELERYKSLNIARHSQMERSGKEASAAIRISSLLGRLANVGDARLVPLIAPLLGEGSPGYSAGDTQIAAPRESAGQALWCLSLRAPNINPPAGEIPNDPAIWDKWWASHRHDFGEIPLPLQRLMATQQSKSGPVPSEEVVSPPPEALQVLVSQTASGEATYATLLGLAGALIGVVVFFYVRRRLRSR
jgi:hypothetical protein